MAMDRQELAELLASMALLLELTGENTFKIRAYQGAARTIGKLTEDLDELYRSGKLETIKGIGRAIARHIAEYAETGTIEEYRQLKSTVAPSLLELVKIPGLGPKKAMAVHAALGVNSIGELEYACRENRLIALNGFGEKTQQAVLRGIEYMKKFQGSLLLAEAWPLAERIAAYLLEQDGLTAAQVAGEVRRRCPTVREIVVVVQADAAGLAALEGILTAMPGVEQVTSPETGCFAAALSVGISLLIRVAAVAEFPTALCLFTGNERHVAELIRLAGEQGWTLAGGRLVTADGKAVPVAAEADVYRKLGLDYPEPELREGQDEIALAARQRLPVLVQPGDLRGAFHMHTTYSDGTASLAAMGEAAATRGWSYIGITDHSRTAVYAGGLSLGQIQAQWQEIERLNANRPDCLILAGIESDILPDGSLDYPDDILAQFDFVIASVHSAFRQSAAEKTKRLKKAMQNRYVTMLGHPTGRILLAREEYPLDMPEIIQTAADTGTIIEINASPYRLDLDWTWCRVAREKGVLLSVNPDAHGVAELDSVVYGVAVARKGGLTAANLLNTRERTEMLTLLKRKR